MNEKVTKNETATTQAKLKAWQVVTEPQLCTANCGDVWTGEVEAEGETLWFFYRDSNGDQYMSKEPPAMRLDLRTFQYRCVAVRQAEKGLRK